MKWIVLVCCVMTVAITVYVTWLRITLHTIKKHSTVSLITSHSKKLIWIPKAHQPLWYFCVRGVSKNIFLREILTECFEYIIQNKNHFSQKEIFLYNRNNLIFSCVNRGQKTVVTHLNVMHMELSPEEKEYMIGCIEFGIDEIFCK